MRRPNTRCPTSNAPGRRALATSLRHTPTDGRQVRKGDACVARTRECPTSNAPERRALATSLRHTPTDGRQVRKGDACVARTRDVRRVTPPDVELSPQASVIRRAMDVKFERATHASPVRENDRRSNAPERRALATSLRHTPSDGRQVRKGDACVARTRDDRRVTPPNVELSPQASVIRRAMDVKFERATHASPEHEMTVGRRPRTSSSRHKPPSYAERWTSSSKGRRMRRPNARMSDE